MAQQSDLDLSVHRFDCGVAQRLGNARFSEWGGYASPYEEELLEFETGDGGRADVTGGGPGGWGYDTTWADIDVSSLSPELAKLIFEYALSGGFIVARWPPDARGHKYAWEVAESPSLKEFVFEEGIFVRAIPLTAYAVTAELALDTPAEWPPPEICLTGSDLHLALARPL